MIQEITEEFVNKYKEQLQANLTLHVKYDKISLEKAGELLSTLMTNIFGNEQHAGIAQFILHNDPSISAEEAVSLAERHFDRGWRIRHETGKYILFDEKFTKVADLSGPAEIRKEETFELKEEEAYIFLNDADAKKLGSIAAKRGIPPRDMVSPTKSYQLIDKYYGNIHDLYPVVQSYYALGKILRKTHYFPGGIPGNTIRALSEQGYKIDRTLNPTTLPQAYLSSGNKKLLIRPITQFIEVEEEYYNEHPVWIPFYKILGIDSEIPEVISDMGQIYALYFERKDIPQDIGEVVRIIENIHENGVSHDRTDRIVSSVAAFLLTENVVRLHNVSLEGIHINTVKLSPVVKYLPREKSRNEQEILTSLENVGSTSDIWEAIKGISSDESSPEFRNALGFLLSKVPTSFKSALKTVDSPIAAKLLERI